MTKKPPVIYPVLPFRKLKYRNLKEALRHGIYSRPDGKSAEVLAMEAGLDRLSDLTRYVSDNPMDPRGKFLEVFLPLLVAMGDMGVEMLDYMTEYVRVGQERRREGEEAAAEISAAKFITEHGPEMVEAIRIFLQTQGKKR